MYNIHLCTTIHVKRVSFSSLNRSEILSQFVFGWSIDGDEELLRSVIIFLIKTSVKSMT